MIRLRDYQQDAHRCIFKEWESVVSTLAVLPTGGGKTILFADVIRTMQPKRALVIAHREELIWQARDKITRVTGLECGIEMADLYVNSSLFGELPVVISTIQTQNSAWGDRKRMGRFRPSDFGVLICDECHHSTAQSYQNLFNYYKQNPDLKILGVTATPDRADEEALGQVFDTVAIDIEILDLIHSGWLVPIEQQFVHINGLDFSKMRTTCGDLNGADLASVMEAENNLQGVAGASVEIIKDRRAIVFTASVKQAEMLCDIFNRHKPNSAAWVCGATNKDARREMLGQFQRGQIQIVCNCGVLTEGFDDPGVEVIIMARPTKSRSLYAQMCGRATRPLPGLVDDLDLPEHRRGAIENSPKPACLIVDFVGNSGRHKLMTSADILGGKVCDAAIERAIIKAKKSGQAVRMDDALDEEEENIHKMMEEARQREAARKARIVAKVSYTSQKISPFDALDLSPVKERGWDNNRTLSEKQKSLLLKQGVNPDTIPYAQARQLIAEMFRRWDHKLCSIKQATVLKKYGYETKNLGREDASKLLDALARNNWRRPAQTQHIPLMTKTEVPF